MEEEKELHQAVKKASPMNIKTAFAILVVVAVAFGGYYLWKNTQGEETMESRTGTMEESTENPISDQATPAASPATMAEGEVQKISVTGTEFSMTPAKISVHPGQKVELTFTNVGQVAHNWVSSDLGVETKTLEPGQSQTLDFTAPEATGEYPFYCTLPGHRAQGMEGVLVVE